jgi:hypothetical protein
MEAKVSYLPKPIELRQLEQKEDNQEEEESPADSDTRHGSFCQALQTI